MKHPFEVELSEILADPDAYIDTVFSCLVSDFLTMPKGDGFVEYDVFERGYEALKAATRGFQHLDPEAVVAASREVPMCLCVLRCILGFSPPEWAWVASERTGREITQGFARSLDRSIRIAPARPLGGGRKTLDRVRALVEVACSLITEGAPDMGPNTLHRLAKADTSTGPAATHTAAAIGVPYAMLLYERFLGRPFASHRDSVSELVGDSLESAIEHVLDAAGVSFRKTKRAERVQGFDQAPDFVVPSEFTVRVVIEAKITEDDGTARDKVTRVQHLSELSRQTEAAGGAGFEVIACIGGRGFGVRREDMRKLLVATRGKVFTPQTLERLVDCSGLREFRSS